MKPMKFGVGQGVKRVEDVRLVSGRGNYTSDASRGRRAQGGVSAQSPRTCEIPDRGSRGRARGAGHPGRLCGERFQQSRPPALRCPGSELRQVKDAAQTLSGHGGGRGRSCRRHRRHGGRRYNASGARRRRIDRRDMGRAARGRRHGRGHPSPGRQRSLPAPRATSPTTPTSGTSRKPTPHSRGRRARLRSRSSTRAWSPTIWSRVRRSAKYDSKSGRLTLNVGSQGVHAIRDVVADEILKIPRHFFASSRRTSAAVSAPSRWSIASIRSFWPRPAGSGARSAGRVTAASISSATLKAATM